MRETSLALCAALLAPHTALAAEAASADPTGSDDYRIENERWNGLSDFASLALGKHLRIVAPAALDIATADPARDAIFVLYPRAGAADPDRLARFVERGGHVLVADDFGGGAALLRRFGAESARDVPHAAPEDPHLGNPALPIARPWGGHALGAGVGRVVLNHPGALRSRLAPVLVARLPVVVAGELGAGRFVLCADPSIFINNMLAQPGNFTFASNLLDYLGRPGGRLVLLAQAFTLSGQATGGDAEGAATFEARVLADFNLFLRDIGALVPLERTLRAAGLLAAAAALAVVLGGCRGPSDGACVRGRPNGPA